ncbi:nuclear transport factor 2 family protein [Actinomadura sp. ATCC 31491]|uniref:Nuclear transport factor 2 family protein n=1 Tax=Actinomadura luzonensis TaxID=2805427 RepID=A0ABT0FRW1_9ACTN|nr:nuclear transport factor 2 family protein [Actinomadura luzonensis]MCK2215072.1 nuclear transport factor 2 family protein [Actinomadura luzonensis]
MSIEEIVAGYHAAMAHKSADELAGLYAANGLHEFPFGGLAPFAGREAVRAGYRAMWGGTPFEAEEVRRLALHRTEDPEVVIVEQVTHVRAGDQAVAVPGLLVLRVRDGEIVHTRDYMDTSAIARVRAAAGV